MRLVWHHYFSWVCSLSWFWMIAAFTLPVLFSAHFYFPPITWDAWILQKGTISSKNALWACWSLDFAWWAEDNSMTSFSLKIISLIFPHQNPGHQKGGLWRRFPCTRNSSPSPTLCRTALCVFSSGQFANCRLCPQGSEYFIFCFRLRSLNMMEKSILRVSC